MIKAGIFDIGGVIHEKSGSYIRSHAMKTLGISKKDMDIVWKKLIHKLGLGKISEEQFWKQLIKEANIVKPLPKESILLREFINNYFLIEGTLNLVSDLQKNGYKAAVLSNTILPHAQYNYKMGIYQKFDVVILSHEVGLRKPDPKIYELTLKRLGVKANEAFFVDDLEENVVVANDLGIHGIVFTDIKSLINSLEQLGVKT